jgi:hypothetical protein
MTPLVLGPFEAITAPPRSRRRRLAPMRRDVILSVSLLAAACGTPPPLTTAATEPATVASATPDADRDGDGVPDPRDPGPKEPEE